MSDDASAAPPDHSSDRAALVLVSTPIGNLGDLAPRGREELAGADLVLCEDTRHTARLLTAIGVSARTEALHEHNEDARIPGILEALRTGKRVVLVSDAGTPLVSDPGYRLVRAVIGAGLTVTAVPGPNAAMTALTLSGLPPLPFVFLGFPPPKEAARRTAFGRLRSAERAGLAATLVWHEAPHRLPEALRDMAAAFGPRPAAVTRELTKRFEEVRRADLTALAAHFATEPARGEITIVVGPPEATEDAEGMDEQLMAAMRTESLRDAAALVSVATGLPRKLVYARALILSRRGS